MSYLRRVTKVEDNGKVFLTRQPRYDSKTDHSFNASGQMSDSHGHVVESRRSTSDQTRYDYVRDTAGNVYIDNRIPDPYQIGRKD